MPLGRRSSLLEVLLFLVEDQLLYLPVLLVLHSVMLPVQLQALLTKQMVIKGDYSIKTAVDINSSLNYIFHNEININNTIIILRKYFFIFNFN